MVFMKKNQEGFSLFEVLMLLAIIAIVVVSGVYALNRIKQKHNDSTASKPVISAEFEKGATITTTGTLDYIDLSPMQVDGSGIYKVKTISQKEVTVSLSSGESTCDRSAITIPNIKVGDTVQIKGIAIDAASLSICQAGTYIK